MTVYVVIKDCMMDVSVYTSMIHAAEKSGIGYRYVLKNIKKGFVSRIVEGKVVMIVRCEVEKSDKEGNVNNLTRGIRYE